MDLTETIIPKSDQINAEDLLAGPQTFTIAKVEKGSTEQPVNIHLAELPGRPYRPSKSMRRVMVNAWGKDTAPYAGRQLRLYRDPDVTFAGEAIGGIKISHLSHIDKPVSVALTVTRGKRAPHVVQPLANAPTTAAPADPTTAMVANYKALNITRHQLEAYLALPVDDWTAETLEKLRVLGGEIASGSKTVGDVFGEAS